MVLSINSPSMAENKANQFVYATPAGLGNYNIFDAFGNQQWVGTLFVGLYARDSDSGYQYTPVLAETMPTIQKTNQESDVKMIARVTLRNNLQFSNGDPLTAEDVAYTYEIFSTSSNMDLTSNAPGLSEVIPIDDQTIEFRFQTQSPFYMDSLSLPILPKNIYQPLMATGSKDYETDPEKYLVGAGPFKLENINLVENSLTVIPNPYWSESTGLPMSGVDRIIFKQIQSANDAIAALKNGDVDILDPFYWYEKDELNDTKEITTTLVPQHATYELSINHIHPVWGRTAQLDLFLGKTFYYTSTNQSYTIKSFWDEISNGIMSEEERLEAARLVREAMAYAMPMETIIKDLDGRGEPATTVMPKTSIGWLSSLKQREYSITKAQDLIIKAFALAGWNNITTVPESTGVYIGDLWMYFNEWSAITLTPESHSFSNWHSALRQELLKIGINATIFEAGWDTIAPRSFSFNLTRSDYEQPDGTHTPVPLWNTSGYDMLIIAYSWGFEFNPEGAWETSAWLPLGYNFYNYWDPDYDTLMLQYTHEFDSNTRSQLVGQLQENLYHHLPSIPLFHPASLWAYDKSWSDFLDLVLLSNMIYEWWKLKPIVSDSFTSDNFLTALNPFSSIIALLGTLGLILVKQRKDY